MMIVDKYGACQQVFEQPDGLTRIKAGSSFVVIKQGDDTVFLDSGERDTFIDALTKIRDRRGGVL